ncbi:hypothetical protein SLEP1_g10619 [Rubroshorea leprosula]|uniref:Uncharacterized protein n=1 Tax=Rubroshorea leprosula TaxID=152421 RepID=A0AAV5IIJ7_9ROSI|nr:hypothetical protein SLEP1_g10619 [Rubroshorea leprosula]
MKARQCYVKQVEVLVGELRKDLEEQESQPEVPSLLSFISFHFLPLVQLHVAVLAAILQPHLHFIAASFHQHLQHSLLHFAATVLWCSLPSSFAASCAAFLPFAASCAALTPQLQQY